MGVLATVFCSTDDSDPLLSLCGVRHLLLSSGDDGDRLRALGVSGKAFGSGEESHSLCPLDGVVGISFIPGEDPDRLCLEGVPEPSLSPGEDPDRLLLVGVLGKPSFISGDDAELLLSLEGVLGTVSSTGEETV